MIEDILLDGTDSDGTDGSSLELEDSYELKTRLFLSVLITQMVSIITQSSMKTVDL